MDIDELLRTEFTSRTEALRASGGKENLFFPEAQFFLRIKDLVEGLDIGVASVNYTVRIVHLKEFDFPWGQRWKFCIQPIV